MISHTFYNRAHQKEGDKKAPPWLLMLQWPENNLQSDSLRKLNHSGKPCRSHALLESEIYRVVESSSLSELILIELSHLCATLCELSTHHFKQIVSAAKCLLKIALTQEGLQVNKACIYNSDSRRISFVSLLKRFVPFIALNLAELACLLEPALGKTDSYLCLVVHYNEVGTVTLNIEPKS